MRFLLFLAALLGAAVSHSQTFNPADHGNVTLHLKADALGLASNAPVPAWGPLTAAGGAQPTFIASDARFQNQPVVKFDGTDDVMTWASANLNARTIFAVTTLESGATNLAGLISNGGDGLNIRRHNTTTFYRSPGQGMDGNDFCGNGSPTGTLSINNVASGAYTAGVPHLVIATAGGLKNYSSFIMGRPNPTLGRYWNGSVAEVVVYDGVLTPQGINAVGYYLQAKYNLPTTFTAPTPTITSFTVTNSGGINSSTGVISSPDAGVTLQFAADNATTISINPGGPTDSPTTNGSVIRNPATTTTYTLSATNAAGTVQKQVTVHIGVTPLPPRLNEFLAENDDGLTDVDGEHSDWLEIYNPNPYAIDLNGYALRNGPHKPLANQWNFPAGSGVEAGGYRVIFASQKNLTNPAGALHTDFSLDNAGEYLALVQIAGNVLLDEFNPTPPQYADISYGWWNNPGQLGYFGVPTGAPTPGAANSAVGVLGFLDKTDDTDFTVTRGFYTTAVTTTISATTPGAKIIYTTNGSEPSETNGTQVLPASAGTPPTITMTIHPGAVPGGSPGVNIASVGGVTTLRAAAFLSGYAPTNIDTQTYLFPTQVLGQTAAHANAKGWPAAAVNGQVFNYGMDPNVVSSFTQNEMIESLQSIPTLSIVTDMKNFVDPATGIYVNADQHGSAWERGISLELIRPPGYVDPDGNTKGFQINAGLRIRGGFSRNDQFFKHGFRLFFSGKYDGKLHYRLFGNEGTDEFGKIDLGTASNYGWHRESSYANGRFNTFCRDPFARDTQGALGQPNTKSRYYHVYLNGHYWGLYYTEERAEAEFAASYMGGDQDEYDTVKCGNHVANFATEATDGNLLAWQSLWNKTRAIATVDASNAKYFEILGRNADGTRNLTLPVLLDVDNLIDEMLVIFYMGDGDAVLSNFLGHDRPNNWFSVYRRTGEHGFRFFIRDAEHTLGTTSWVADQTGPWGGTFVNDFTYSNPQRMHQDLMSSAEYKLRFADRVRKHFFDNGALTPAQCIARFQARAGQIEKGMKVESARWGDAQTITGLPGGHPPRYVVADWQDAVNNVVTNILPTRTATVLAQLQADGLYPTATAPSLTDAGGTPHYGGPVAVGFQLRITAPAGTIYFTIDGTDPRLPGGAIAPGAITATSPIPLTLNSTVTVSARVLNGAAWSALTQAEYLVGALGSASNLVISKIHYNPASATDLEEFIEVMNISAVPVDLTNCYFTNGIEFTFPDAYILGAGARCLIVRDLAAFQAAYPTVPAGQIAGVFTSGALNNGGESLAFLDTHDDEIQSFEYDNNGQWPEAADGLGPCLVLINPALNPDPAQPENWRASVAAGGTPGASDALSYAAWAAANGVTDLIGTDDGDGDGSRTLLEYTLDTDPHAPNGPPISHAVQNVTADGVTSPYLTLTFTRTLNRDEAALAVQASSDLLQPWVPAILVGAPIHHGDGTETCTYRHPNPRTGDSRQFLRLKSTRVP